MANKNIIYRPLVRSLFYRIIWIIWQHSLTNHNLETCKGRLYKTWEVQSAKNTIGATKMRNNFGTLESVIFSNIAIVILDFSLLLLVKLFALNLLCFIYGISFLLLFLIPLSKVITLPTITIARVVALSHS